MFQRIRLTAFVALGSLAALGASAAALAPFQSRVPSG